ncbi:MAG: hypothetical protein WDO56_36070 [Gammaproteobacteria bacterium]
MPAFLSVHPVTGKNVRAVGSAKMVATKVLTGAITRREAAAGARSSVEVGEPRKSAAITLDEARRRLARSAAWDGVANISATYGYYVDDSDAAGWAGVMAAKGFKQTPFQGYHVGRDRLIAARVKGKGPEKAGRHFVPLAHAAGRAGLRRRPLRDGPLQVVPAAHGEDGGQGG